MRIYVASSWKNPLQPIIVRQLEQADHIVYDYRKHGFSWGEVNMPPEPSVWEYTQGLSHPRAAQGFLRDFKAMQWADACVLVLPCGRSSHLELGWMLGRGKLGIILTQDGEEPDLMAMLADHICENMTEVLDCLEQRQGPGFSHR